MSDFEFQTFKRYDKAAAAEGEWYDAIDENGNKWGRFKLRHYDGTKASTALAVTRARKRHAQAIRTKTVDQARLTLDIMIEADSFVDWEMNGKTGPIPYSIEALRKYFALEETKWIIFRLSDFSDDIGNFQGALEDEEAKND